MPRSTMTALISRMRLLVNDTGPTASQSFTDDMIQDVMDEGREDIKNMPMIAKPTFSGSTIQYLDYYTAEGFTDWEDDWVIKQYLVVPVTPSQAEPIAAHWIFSASTLPPLYISGKSFDVYRSAADLLERLAARWVLRYDAGVDGQNLRRSQAAVALLNLAKNYRMKQRARTISVVRSDLTSEAQNVSAGLGAEPIYYMASGNG